MKYSKSIITNLREELQKPLPGEAAQFRMAPAYRPQLNKEQIMANNPREGGVLLLLYEKENSLNIVFTQRKVYDGVHSGQMSFPGGKKEAADENMIETALRETCEEIGTSKNKIEVLGSLSQLYIPPSNFLVYPAVGFAEKIETFNPQKEEVERIVEIPLDFFMDKKNIDLQKEILLFNKTTVKVPAYVYLDYIIWGATAIILSEFTFIMERIEDSAPSVEG